MQKRPTEAALLMGVLKRRDLLQGSGISTASETRRYDAAVEDAIAICNGDIMGALKALLIVNEHLESQLMELQAAMATGGAVERRTDQSEVWTG
jgi:hypothetical protein